jgi:hypothetical protein
VNCNPKMDIYIPMALCLDVVLHFSCMK